MLQVIGRLIGVIIVLVGIILIYDARMITKRFFSFGDQNDATQRIEDFWLFHNNFGWFDCIFCLGYVLKRKNFTFKA